MVTVHPVHLLPTLPARIAEHKINVFEGLVDLDVDFFVESAGVAVPTACEIVLVRRAPAGCWLPLPKRGEEDRP